MVPAPYGYGLVIAYYFLLLCIALIAHGVWVERAGRSVWHWRKPLPARLAVIATAAMTPLIGFYAALVIQRFRRPSAFRPPASQWTIIMPGLALCVILYLAMQQNWRYTEATRSWENVIRFLPGYFAFYCATQAVLYMAARVFGLSRRGPLATRVHLVSIAAVVLVAMAT
jgi:hypothetical protein